MRALLLAVVMAGCNGATSPSNPVAVTGFPGFVAGDVFASRGDSLRVEITSWGNACARAADAVSNGALFLVDLYDAGPGSGVAAAGPADFVVGAPDPSPQPPHFAVAHYLSLSPRCQALEDLQATGGSLHLSSVNANGVAGEGDLAFASGQQAHVQFIAPSCGASDQMPLCVPN